MDVKIRTERSFWLNPAFAILGKVQLFSVQHTDWQMRGRFCVYQVAL